MKIILGSKSERRKELLNLLGYDFVVVTKGVDEMLTGYLDSKDYVRQITLKKGLAIAPDYPNSLVICADTIVAIDHKILGKPKDEQDATRIIELLSGRKHQVLTGVFLKYKDEQKVFVEETTVEFVKLEANEISEYVATPEPYDKAGGYAIQGLFSKYVKSIEGDYYNVMGLPISRLYQEIKRLERKYQISISTKK